MSNHYHLLVETPEPNLVAGMRWFQTTWTIRFNRRHHLSGHLLQGRYKAVVVDPEERNYLVALSDYIHLNPVRAGLVSLEGRLYAYEWSSYRLYVASSGRPDWFEPQQVLGELGLQDTAAGRGQYAQRKRARAVECSTSAMELQEELRRGWCLGGASFRERMLGLIEAAGERITQCKVDATVSRSHSRDEAERLFRRGLEHFRLSPDALPQLRRNETPKQALARVIRERTAVDNGWIARALHLGHESAVSRSLRNRTIDQLLKLRLGEALDS